MNAKRKYGLCVSAAVMILGAFCTIYKLIQHEGCVPFILMTVCGLCALSFFAADS